MDSEGVTKLIHGAIDKAVDEYHKIIVDLLDSDLKTYEAQIRNLLISYQSKKMQRDKDEIENFSAKVDALKRLRQNYSRLQELRDKDKK